MKILFVTDWHGHDYEIPDKDNVDVLIVLGDLDWRQVNKLDKTYDCPKLGLLGNHDRWDIYRNTNFIHLHKEIFEYEGIRFAGFEGSPRYNFKDSPQYEEIEVAHFTEKLEDVDIFIAHSNPMLIQSYDQTDAHRGFNSFTKYIYEKQPRYFIHGHIHEESSQLLHQTELISVFPTLYLEI